MSAIYCSYKETGKGIPRYLYLETESGFVHEFHELYTLRNITKYIKWSMTRRQGMWKVRRERHTEFWMGKLEEAVWDDLGNDRKIILQDRQCTVRKTSNWGEFVQPPLQWKRKIITHVELCACRFRYTACNAQEPYYVVNCRLSCSTAFSHVS